MQCNAKSGVFNVFNVFKNIPNKNNLNRVRVIYGIIRLRNIRRYGIVHTRGPYLSMPPG